MLFTIFKKIPLMYRYAVIAFTVIAISAFFSSPNTQTAFHFFIAIVAAIVFDLIFNYVKNRKVIVPYSAYISGLIIALLLEPSTEFTVLLFVILVAISSKHLLRWKGKTVFNPATFAIVFSALFLVFSVTWHGTNSWPVILVVGLLLLYKIGRLAIGLSFYIFFGVLMALNSIILGLGIVTALTSFFLGGYVIFFSFFMVTEPKTTPFTTKGQILFGILAALFSFSSQFFVPEFFPLIGLLAANVFTQTINKLTLKK